MLKCFILGVNKFPISNLIKKPFQKWGIHTTAALSVKEIVETKEEKKTVIEGIVKESDRVPYLVKTEHDADACPICRLNLDIKHTDVLILSQFVRKDGCMLPRRITGLCIIQQKRMSKLVSMAHIAGLMPNLVPHYSKKNCFKKRREWKKYNTYFDESTIKSYDAFYRDKHGVKEEYYKQKGIEFNPEPWKDKIFTVDITPKKLKFY